MKRATVTIYVPDGYKDAEEFLRDCAFEPASAGDIFNTLLAHVNFDGMNPRTFSLGELEDAIDGATTKGPLSKGVDFRSWWERGLPRS